MLTMAIRVRSITAEESEILNSWQRCDDIVRYRRARILRLSEAGWRCPVIAEILALHVETVRWVIKTFNEGGIEAITPQPRSGGRPPSALSQNRYRLLGWVGLSLEPGSVASFLGLFDTPMEVALDSCLELANGLE